MTFQEIIKLLYVNSAYFKTQPDFLNNLLIGSVDDSNKISLSQSTLKGFFQGNKITNLAPQLIEAGFSVDNLSAYIESLYKNSIRIRLLVIRNSTERRIKKFYMKKQRKNLMISHQTICQPF